MNYGIKVSKEGYDIQTADPKDQIFNSSFNNFKIYKQGEITISVDGDSSDDSVQVAHDLGYIPGFIAFAQLRGTTVSYPLNAFDLLSGGGETFTAVADSSNITFTAADAGTSYTAYIYYYIFADRGI